MGLLRKVLLVALVSIIAFGIYAYFFVISPAFVEKPVIEAPPAIQHQASQSAELETPQPVEEEHIQYLVNELGGYKLHEDPLTDEIPEIEVLVTDTGQVYSVKIINNYPEVAEGEAENPDLRLTASQEQLLILLAADDFESEVVALVNEGKMGIEIIADEQTLALKGYKAIYDAMTKTDDTPTGNFIRIIDVQI